MAAPAGHGRSQLASTDPPWGMAEPLSHDGHTLGRVCLRKGKMLHIQCVRRQKKKKVRGTALQAPRLENEEGRCSSRRHSRDRPAAHGKHHAGADVHCGGPHGGAIRYFLKATAASGEKPVQEQVLLTENMAHGGPTLGQVYWEGPQPMEWTHAGAGERCEGEGVAER